MLLACASLGVLLCRVLTALMCLSFTHRHEVQGATVNFEVLGDTGRVLGYRQIGDQLGQAGIHLRTGCTCNPGACYEATGEDRRTAAWQPAGCCTLPVQDH